jgi:hypothetical protein
VTDQRTPYCDHRSATLPKIHRVLEDFQVVHLVLDLISKVLPLATKGSLSLSEDNPP